jgi:hypothetical protein
VDEKFFLKTFIHSLQQNTVDIQAFSGARHGNPECADDQPHNGGRGFDHTAKPLYGTTGMCCG